jgi:transcriptional regulator with XRE-family HTH domain
MTSADSWGAIVADLQAEHGLSTRQLARIAGVHRSTLTRSIKGERSFSVSDLECVLAVFGYELDVLQIADHGEEA